MRGRRPAGDPKPAVFRIGEVAKLTGLTSRTLRYWEELGLVQPTSHGANRERLYSPADMARAGRIRDLQELLGFSLAEERVVLDTEDVGVLDRVRAEMRSGELATDRRRVLLDEAMAANDQLLVRLDDTLARIQAFRAARLESGTRLRADLAALDAEADVAREAPSLHRWKE